MTLTGLPTTDYIAEENKVSSHNHGLVQGRLATLFNLSIPQLRESLLAGLNTPVAECDQELEW